MITKFDINGIKMDVISFSGKYQKNEVNKNFSTVENTEFKMRLAAFGSKAKENYGKLIEIFDKKDVDEGVDATIELIDDATKKTITTISLSNTHIVDFSLCQPELNQQTTNIQNLSIERLFIDLTIKASQHTLFGTQIIES